MRENLGILGQPAPELRVAQWLANVDDPGGLKIADLDAPVIYLYNFQAKPRLLAWLLEPLMNRILRRETTRRLHALRRYLEKLAPDQRSTEIQSP